MMHFARPPIEGRTCLPLDDFTSPAIQQRAPRRELRLLQKRKLRRRAKSETIIGGESGITWVMDGSSYWDRAC